MPNRKQIITVVGLSNSGKTSIVKEIFRQINFYYDNIKFQNEGTNREVFIDEGHDDFYSFFEINGHMIGLFTFCDIPEKAIDHFLPKCIEKECDLIIMTSRTRGNLKDELEKGYSDYHKNSYDVDRIDENSIDKWKSFMHIKKETIDGIMKDIDKHLGK